LTSGRHPLLARVHVNHIWQSHFGRGIVATPGDFGVLGDRPTHPELLDWLACEFSATELDEHGRWSVKRLHRLIVTSAAYRQSSVRNSPGDAVDPDNRLLSRMPVRRLPAESVRDSILTANGTINHKLGGTPVPVMLDEDGQVVVGIENLNGENRPGPIIPLNGEEYRRSLYVQVRRTRPLAVLDAFDLPALDPNCTVRNSSTVAPQSLMLMNSDFVLAAARQLADRLKSAAGAEADARIRLGWQLLFARPPREQELASARQFIRDEIDRLTAVADATADTKQKPDPEQWAWTAFCQALLGSNEFLYID
jgi:hypothetical protein